MPDIVDRRDSGDSGGQPCSGAGPRRRRGGLTGKSTAGRIILILACAFGSVPVARAQELTAEVEVDPGAGRLNAPIPLRVRFRRPVAAPLPGVLKCDLRRDFEVVLHYESPRLTLTRDDQTFRLTLPPVSAGRGGMGDVTLEFVSDRGDHYPLGEHTLTRLATGARTLTLAASLSPASAGRYQVLLRMLRLGQTIGGEHLGFRRLLGSTVSLLPEELPRRPLDYTAYDLVLLPEDGFSFLDEAQLAALARWVGAGGSVCVIPGRGLKIPHLAFINEVTCEGRSAPFFSLDAWGGLRSDDGGGALPAAVRTFSYGLGCVAIIDAAPQSGARGEIDLHELLEDHADEVWSATLFLWRVKSEEARRARGSPELWQRELTNRELFVEPIGVGDSIVRTLLPRGVRMVPTGVMVLLLLLFLGVVGPGDYLLLGALRRRRLTWLLLPTTAVLFTLATIRISGHYLEGGGRRASLRIADVGEGGRILRESSLQVAFSSKRTTRVELFEEEIFTAMDHRWFARQRSSVGPIRDSVPGYRGDYPGSYEVRQTLAKFSPQLNRVFAIPSTPGAPPIDLDWDRFAADSPRDDSLPGRLRDFFAQRLLGLDLRCAVFLIHGSSPRPIPMAGVPRPREGALTGPFLTLVSARPESKLFEIVSRISPHGGADFEDLTLLDPSSDREWVLAVVVETGEETVCYRRLFHGGEE